MKMRSRLLRVNGDIKNGLRRQRKIIRWLNKLKARKNAYNSRRMLQKAAAGAMGSIPQALKSIRDMLHRHEMILLKLSRGGRRRILRHHFGRRCGSLALARRRLKRAVSIVVRLKKQPMTYVTSRKLRKWRRIVEMRHRALREIIKCKGLILCGNLRKAERNLARARSKLIKANRIASERPSDEDAQKDRHTYRNRVKYHKQMIKKIWDCMCSRAIKKYRMYKNLYEQEKSPVYLRRMKLHRRMIRRCNCRRAKINFNKAKNRFERHHMQYAQNPQDTTAKDNAKMFYDRIIFHKNKLQSYGCRVPAIPPNPFMTTRGVKVMRRR
jgi:hypothetical protein